MSHSVGVVRLVLSEELEFDYKCEYMHVRKATVSKSHFPTEKIPSVT